MNKNICILFGAGADAPFKICKGNDFANKALRLDAKLIIVIEEVIKKHYKKKLDNCKNSDWYPSYRGARFEIDNLLKRAVTKMMHDQNEQSTSKGNFEEHIKQRAKSYKEKNMAIDIISKYPNYMGILDENFHTLISPKRLGPYKFWRVIITYTSAYLAICMDILGISAEEKEKILSLLSEPKKTYRRIESKIDENLLNEKSYYKTLGDYYGRLNYNIITTNYTPICEKVLFQAQQQLKQEMFSYNNIAYIHGRLTWFECPYTLQVYDTECEDDREAFENYLLFPYLFIQSGVKPIVERKQLEEYSKALQFLKDADEIAIIGYSLNVDDNNLNSLLHSYTVRKERRITYFAFNDRNLNEKVIGERLRNPRDKTADLNIIHIDNDNSIKEFEGYLASLAK